MEELFGPQDLKGDARIGLSGVTQASDFTETIQIGMQN